mmetsp:Transcript_22858/g.50773  ORF Transcript_22858/g.50773 Transcript_22858/m.50773 type:complete len:348 (+) Transcript_22858:136-1179(+)
MRRANTFLVFSLIIAIVVVFALLSLLREQNVLHVGLHNVLGGGDSLYTRVASLIGTGTYSRMANSTDGSAFGNDTTDGTPAPFVVNKSCTCCCYNSNTDFSCCERMFRPTHKMGFYATLDLMKALQQVYGTNKISMMQGFKDLSKPKDIDYRDAVVTRNVYAALISGYLYHRTGRECNLTPHGNPWNKTVVELMHFENYLSGTLGRIDPPVRDRSLCQYLADESEEVGVKVYMDWAFEVYYSKVLRHYEFTQSSPERKHKTIFLCFEKLTGNRTELREFLWETYDLFFPGGGMRVMIKPKQSGYAGGHATDQDPELRSRLQALIENYDQQYFNSMAAKFQSTFPCGI